MDTGGTFTDCLALLEDDTIERLKVLSSASIRGYLGEVIGPGRYRFDQPHRIPENFFRGYRMSELSGLEVRGRESWSAEVVWSGENGEVSIGRDVEGLSAGVAVSLQSPEEAPILAARLVTGRRLDQSLDDVTMRLATTRATNALLERRGAATALFVTAGHRDLLAIGFQDRPALFEIDVRKTPPLYTEAVEVVERLAADGTVVRSLDLEALEAAVSRLLAAEIRCAAVALLHSYANPRHELAVAEYLRRRGFEFVTCSHEVAPLIKILPRAQTAVVDSYLAPTVQRYLSSIGEAVSVDRLHLMTSAGGLVKARSFHPRDSLLSGPAGGVVGAAYAGRRAGHTRVLGFDMGGTSTDVARVDGGFEYTYEHRVGDATIVGPALAIETVAAGGGSICRFDGDRLRVGPESAGAEPGPACYGAGGPLTLTDVNLLLGRIIPERFEIPIDGAAAVRAIERVENEIERAGTECPDRGELLAGFLSIANERMADAMRRISIQRGYDPREYALVSFGGAGSQHACAIASGLGVDTVIVPEDASLLSALGLGVAVIERFAQRQLLVPLEEIPGSGERSLAGLFSELAAEARGAVRSEGVPPDQLVERHRLLSLRLAGQESSLEIEWEPGLDVAAAFAVAYDSTFGYRPFQRSIEVESMRVVVSSPVRGFRSGQHELDHDEEIRGDAGHVSEASRASDGVSPSLSRRSWFAGEWRKVEGWSRRAISETPIAGPLLVAERHSVVVVETGWQVRRCQASGALLLDR